MDLAGSGQLSAAGFHIYSYETRYRLEGLVSITARGRDICSASYRARHAICLFQALTHACLPAERPRIRSRRLHVVKANSRDAEKCPLQLLHSLHLLLLLTHISTSSVSSYNILLLFSFLSILSFRLSLFILRLLLNLMVTITGPSHKYYPQVECFRLCFGEIMLCWQQT